jgi:hypothetical protein
VPRPLRDGAADAGADRVLEHVAADPEVVVLRLDHLRPEPSLEDVARLVVPVVERHRVDAVEVVHALRDVRVRRLHDQVVVGRHQAVGVDRPPAPAGDLAEESQKELAVVVAAVDRRPADAARDDVVDPVRDARTAEAGHAPTVRRERRDASRRATSGTHS